MSFIGVKGYDGAWIILDDELGEIKVKPNADLISDIGSLIPAVIEAYGKHNLPVGRNLALAYIFMQKKGINIKGLIVFHDEYCSKYVSNWFQYAKERDEHLAKLLPLL